MTHQQELELLAEWLGIGGEVVVDQYIQGEKRTGIWNNLFETCWNPSPTGNSDDFLNMVAGRLNVEWWDNHVNAYSVDEPEHQCSAFYADHNNDKVAAMKHAAYQVCLMAAREGKENGN